MEGYILFCSLAQVAHCSGSSAMSATFYEQISLFVVNLMIFSIIFSYCWIIDGVIFYEIEILNFFYVFMKYFESICSMDILFLF